MSITKQILFIAIPSKVKELEQLLSMLCQLSQNNTECEVADIYKCEDDSNEFLFFEQWNCEKAYSSFKASNMYKDFESKSKSLILKKEILRLD